MFPPAIGEKKPGKKSPADKKPPMPKGKERAKKALDAKIKEKGIKGFY